MFFCSKLTDPKYTQLPDLPLPEDVSEKTAILAQSLLQKNFLGLNQEIETCEIVQVI